MTRVSNSCAGADGWLYQVFDRHGEGAGPLIGDPDEAAKELAYWNHSYHGPNFHLERRRVGDWETVSAAQVPENDLALDHLAEKVGHLIARAAVVESILQDMMCAAILVTANRPDDDVPGALDLEEVKFVRVEHLDRLRAVADLVPGVLDA